MLHSALYNFQRGIALITVLLFLQLAAILGLYSLSVSLLSEKMNSEAWQRESTALMADELLHGIIIKLQDDIPHCTVEENRELNLLSNMAWQQLPIACMGHFQRLDYYYIVEKLGEDPCARLLSVDMNQLAAHYFRITLLVMVKKINIKMVLQSTAVRPLDRIGQCDGISYPVSIGQQTWHVL